MKHIVVGDDIWDYSSDSGKQIFAFRRTDKKKAILKVISKSNLIFTPELLEKIKLETSVIILLNHPHLLKLLNVIYSSDEIYLLYEYPEQDNLSDYINKNISLKISNAIQIFRGIIYALEYLNAHQITNFFLDPTNIYINEFGDAKLIPSIESGENILDTENIYYTAPEVIPGEKYDEKKANVWKCGVILYSLLEHNFPFYDKSIRATVNKIKSGKFRMADAPEDVQDLITRMLTVSADDRITIEGIKSHPAFRIGLPDEYKLPKPLQVPPLDRPIDPSTLDRKVYDDMMNHSFYISEEEVKAELTSSCCTHAKIILALLNKNFVYNSLPWSGGASMCAKMAASDEVREEEIDGICGEVELVMCSLQTTLTMRGFEWFHQSDSEMVSKSRESDLIVEFSCTRMWNNELKLNIILEQGENEQFEILVGEVKELILSTKK